MDAISSRRFLGTCLAASTSALFAQTAKLFVLGKVAPRDSFADHPLIVTDRPVAIE